MHSISKPKSTFRRLLTSEAGGGIILMIAAAAALVVANSPMATAYFRTLQVHVGGLSVLEWINDGLMAVFFLMVGLEIKREFIEGQLATWPRRILPAIAALGGMVAPALVYVAFNLGSFETLRGWAIPTATDIAFALGALALLGSRIPASLKIFLAALAILDDLGAVSIIAIFYTDHLAPAWLAAVVATFGILLMLNYFSVTKLTPYLVMGVVLWFFMLKSGVHATLAGVALALSMPLARTSSADLPPLLKLEHAIQTPVAFLIVPIFGFANAGVSFAGMDWAVLTAPVTLGVAAGLFLGKQVGVFLATWAAVGLRLAVRPDHATWLHIYGVALLCGIGFTMSLFIGILAFPGAAVLQNEVKVGVLIGSVTAGVLGMLVLSLTKGKTSQPEARSPAAA
ncbi:Na+/H+ antiporter NhaA [Tardiphaga sp. 1201_B9_N1_1]|uniref:Na+/H+ antiporter NhaA n=1 Tax=unclassified Tardiphaga TaxID=2631404 RepID=UPI003F287B02